MLYNATKRELLEGLIVAELISKRGQGPLARRLFPMGERGPASGVRSLGARAKKPAPPDAREAGASDRGALPGPAEAGALDPRGSEPAEVDTPREADDTPALAQPAEPTGSPSAAAPDEESEEPS